MVTDTSRDETFAPGKKRDIEIVAWYPARRATGTQPAPYMRDGMEEALSFARLAKLGDAFNGLASVKTHATIDAAPAATPARFPVILFQHGYTGLPSSHTALMEDLASHGWAVLNLIHPYEATGAMLADGTVVTFTDEKNAMRPGIMDVLNEWGPEGGTMEKVVAAADDAEKEKLMRGYLADAEEHRSGREAVDARCEVRARSSAEDRRGGPARSEARSVAARRRGPFDGRRGRRAVLRRGSPLQGRRSISTASRSTAR